MTLVFRPTKQILWHSASNVMTLISWHWDVNILLKVKWRLRKIFKIHAWVVYLLNGIHCIKTNLFNQNVSSLFENQYETPKESQCGNVSTPICDVPMHKIIVPYSSNVCRQSRLMKPLDTSVANGKCEQNVTTVGGMQFQQCWHFADIHFVPI